MSDLSTFFRKQLSNFLDSKMGLAQVDLKKAEKGETRIISYSIAAATPTHTLLEDVKLETVLNDTPYWGYAERIMLRPRK